MNVEMPELISKAAAIEYLMTNMGWRDEDGYEVDDADEKRAIITDLVKGIPAVDAVTVVRCKDCEYWEEGIEGEGECGCFEFRDTDGVTVHMIKTPWDWYCGNGERRD